MSPGTEAAAAGGGNEVTSTAAETREASGRPLLAERLSRPFQRFFAIEAASGVLLLGATVVALVWANSPFGHAYEQLWHTELAIHLGSWSLGLTLHEWVSDALMTIFFFTVGLEIKRELAYGELSSRDRAMLPVLGALGGMVLPAAIYASVHWGEPTLRGWGIPMATDIAFAVTALSVFGARVPPGLKVFLLALAIADDLGAVAVIAIFYTADLSLPALGLAILGLGFCVLLNQIGVRAVAVYVVVGCLVWLAMLKSGVHATVAGVALGFLTPARPLADPRPVMDRAHEILAKLRELLHAGPHVDHHGHERHRLMRELAALRHASMSPLDSLLTTLEPWVAFAIMPLFALANAGVHLNASTFGDTTGMEVGLAVALGLLVGKPVGITLFAFGAIRSGLASMPRGVTWGQVFGTGVLAGIGFTVALFVTNLAFETQTYIDGSKIGILGGSFLATVLGVFTLSRTLPRQPVGEPRSHG